MFLQKNLNKFRFLQLTFTIFVKYKDAVRQSQIGNVISVCLCAHLSLYLSKLIKVWDKILDL